MRDSANERYKDVIDHNSYFISMLTKKDVAFKLSFKLRFRAKLII